VFMQLRCLTCMCHGVIVHDSHDRESGAIHKLYLHIKHILEVFDYSVANNAWLLGCIVLVCFVFYLRRLPVETSAVEKEPK